jgi:nucleoside-diphosphate-sugar epimerase
LADNSKIKKYLNWHPKVDFVEYLKKELNKWLMKIM